MTTRFWRMALMGVMCVLVASCARDRSIRTDFGSDGGQRSNIGSGRGDLSSDDLGQDIPSSGGIGDASLASDRRLQPVYFEYNSAALRPDVQDALDGYADYLAENAALRVQIEGHCDERGTLEYNLALGERRAQTVRKYLARKGVSASRLYTISYGEEKPQRRGHSESAWRYNRRAEFQVAR